MANKEKEFYESVNAIPVVMHEKIRNFMNETRDSWNTFEKFLKGSRIWYASDIELRKELFGKQSFCATYSSKNWVWKIELEHGFLWILTSKEGTTYEFYSPGGKDDELAEEIIAFLSEKYKDA